MAESADAVIIEPASTHRASVIWLHGLGANGHDFEPIVPELRLPLDSGIRFIFPHAPVRAVTINGGMRMRAWYDIRNVDLRRNEDAESIEDSRRMIDAFIDAEITAGIPSQKIILAGFSQGGAITLYAGLRCPHKLGGLLVLSSYLPLPEKLAAGKSVANMGTPVLMCHGEYDPVIPVSAGLDSCQFLKKAGYNVDWRDYRMEHSVCMEEVRDISRWLQQTLI